MFKLDFQYITVTVSIFAFLATLYKLWSEQKKYHKLEYNKDKRLEYKLRIYEILLNDILSVNQILLKFQDHSPFDKIDSIEIRKSIYEMLVEKTLVSFDDGSYAVDTIRVDEEEQDTEEES